MTNLTLHESLRALEREAQDLAATVLRDHNLTYNQYLTLACIGDHAPISAADVSKHLTQAPGSVAHATSTLRGRGYVMRENNPPNGLVLPLYITQTGLAVLAAATKSMLDVDRQLRRYLTDTTAEGITNAYLTLRDWYDLPI